MINPDTLAESFRERRGHNPDVWAMAPGRVNLIGEHTDYNEGFVLPAAIDRYVGLVGIERPDTRCVLYSTSLAETSEFDLTDLRPGSPADFGRYAAGIAWVLSGELGARSLTGLDLDICSDLPVGAGVSSSAAFEVAFATLWNGTDGLGLTATQAAKLARRAENDYVGLKCGIMDQLASAEGRQGHCLLIDTRSLDIRPVKIPPDLAIVVCDTGKARGLTESAYNERWRQCHEAAEALGVSALRDANLDLLETRRDDLPEITYRRARHVISENERVTRFVEALNTADRVGIGSLMADSHRSLREDYEVSCPELDTMVAAAKEAPGCAGVRMTGAGFGGCCVALVEKTEVDRFVLATESVYSRTINLKPSFIACDAAHGARCGRYDFV